MLSGNKPVLGQTVNPMHPLSWGLVGCWVMNEGSGKVLMDISGNSNHMTAIDNPYWSSDQWGHAVNLDGTDDGYGCNVTKGLNYGTGLTVCHSIYATPRFDGFFDVITGKGDKTTGHYETYWSASGGKFSFYAHDLADSIEDSALRKGYASYQQLTATYDGRTMRLFANQFHLVSKVPAVTGPIPATSAYFKIAPVYAGVKTYLGKMRYCYIWNRALSLHEISQVYFDPYCFIQPVRPAWLKYYEPPAAGIPKHMDYYRRMRAR